jgi:hypothetical protein
VAERRIPWKQLCGAKAKSTGKPCEKWTLYGATRCKLHGGATPGAKKKAEERIRFLAELCMEEAVNTVIDVLRTAPAKTRLETAMAILAQGGLSLEDVLEGASMPHIGPSRGRI